MRGLASTLVVLVLAPLAGADILWTPHYDILPSAPVTFLGGYELRGGDLLFGESGAWPGLPACDGAWSGPAERYAASTRRQLTIGFDTLTGFLAIEEGNGTLAAHREWRCSGRAFADASICGGDHRGLIDKPAFARLPPETPRSLGSGWKPAGPSIGGRAEFSRQEHGTTLDLQVQAIRGVETFEAIPFTGRAYWREAALDGEGYRSDDYILGRNACTNASAIGSEMVPAFDATSATPMVFGAMSTGGTKPYGILPGYPLGPVGEWLLRLEACNMDCPGAS